MGLLGISVLVCSLNLNLVCCVDLGLWSVISGYLYREDTIYFDRGISLVKVSMS